MKLIDYVIDGRLMSPGQIMMNKEVFDIRSCSFHKLPYCESTANYFFYRVDTRDYTFRPGKYIDSDTKRSLRSEDLYIKDKLAKLLYG